jgi:hypothetical protein
MEHANHPPREKQRRRRRSGVVAKLSIDTIRSQAAISLSRLMGSRSRTARCSR